MSRILRYIPLIMTALLWLMILILWPIGTPTQDSIIAWLNIVLLAVLSLVILNYGIRSIREPLERSPGSRLRAKLVIAMVSMLLIPATILQITANQMVERSMDVWFDVRVDTLLDRALNLAQGFYARIDNELKQGLVATATDRILLDDFAGLPASYGLVNSRLHELMIHEGWDSIQVFDMNERLVTNVRHEGLSSVETDPLDDEARTTMALGLVTTKFISRDNEELAIGYAPIRSHQQIVGLLRAQVLLPHGIVQDSRAVESDYRTYRQLERNRQAIRGVFTHGLLIATLLIAMASGVVAIGYSRRLTAPIGDLARALEQVTEGDLSVTIPTAPEDELGSLVHSFNRMALRLKQNVEALERTQQELTEALDSSRQRQYVLETLLANLQSGVLLIDADGNIRLLNQSVRELLNLSTEWLPGQPIDPLCQGKLYQIGQFYNELLHQKGDALQLELELTIENRRLHILARGARLSGSDSSGFSGYLMVLDDVSTLVEAQRHRAWAEVAQRLAHEIKNPLTPIKLAAERLQRRFRKTADDQEVFDSCTHAIISQVERLQRLILDFSDLARMPKPKPLLVHASELTTDMRELYSSYPRLNVQGFDEEVEFYCDADQIRQVLINLVDNALAATEANEATVHLYGDVSDGYVQFHIQDNGSGIPEKIAEHIFEAYFSTKDSGSGLGLSIAKRIADEHGGELLLISASRPTHFCLRLPIEQTSMEQS